MKKFLHKRALLFFFFLPLFAHANLIKVNDLGDPSPIVAGNKNLRDAIIAAAPGDTVIMDIKGNITLTSSLMIDKPIHLMGAFPVHNTITLAPGVELQFNYSGTQIFFSGFRVTGSGVSGTTGIRVFASTYLVMENCVVENMSSTANGGAVFVSGQLSANYCAFINNQTTLEGGAVYMSNATFADFNSCTFGVNTGAQGGGAIYCSGSLQVNNCTFANNTSTTTGRDIKSNLAGSLVTSFNSIYAHTSGGPADFDNSSGSWSSYGGNTFTATPPGGTFTSGTDQIVAVASLGMTALYTDGFGLKYYRLIPGSVAIDFGLTVGGTLPAKDCRRAPRTLYRTALKPDCGAFEFTPYTVTNSSSSTGISGSLPYQLIQIGITANPGPYFVDFGIGSPSAVTISAVNGITKAQIIIDGYTEAGSLIPGPGVSPMTVTPGIMGFSITTTGGVDAMAIMSGANNFSICGIGFYTGDHALNFYGGTNAQVFGNYFNGMTQAAIYTNNVSVLMVGGEYHHQRNIISNSVKALHFTGSNNIKVRGNFIGTDDVGMNLAGSGNGWGIHAVSVVGLAIGGDHFRGRGNLISGSLSNGVEFTDVTNGAVHGNYFGLNYNGTGAIENKGNGLLVSGTGTNLRIGKTGKSSRNYFCNTDLSDLVGGAGIKLQGYTGGDIDIYNNSIGVDKNNVNAPNSSGVIIINSNGVSMGDGTFQRRNVICNSLHHGIYMDGSTSSNNYFNKNFIGLKEDNGPGPNNGSGFVVINNVASSTIINNVISNNVGDGVQVYSCGVNNSVSGNFIGTDSTGTIDMGNEYGIYLYTSGTGTILASNEISGNNQDGIYAENTPNTLIKNNIIGLNITTNAMIPNARGIRANSCAGLKIGDVTGGNHISGNNGNGVELNQCNGFSAIRNFIGTNGMLAPLPNQSSGISVLNTLGGAIGNVTTPVDSNTIMHNIGMGVFVSPGSTHINIGANRMAQNGNLGISLNNSSPLANDLNDPDGVAYGNDGQNYPVLSVAVNCGGYTKVAGTINVDVADGVTSYRVDFYSILSGIPDGTGHGEGEHYITSITLIPGTGMNTLNFATDLPGVPLPVGTRLTATCSKKNTATEYSTSEFCANIIVTDPVIPDATVLTNVTCNGGSDGSATVTHGGSAPFTYQWYTGSTSLGAAYTTSTATSLAAGNYYVVVTDATTCALNSDTVTITEPGLLAYTLTPTGETCTGDNDGSVSLVISTGGTSNFTAKFYNSVSALINTYTGITYGATTTESNLAPGNYAVLITDASGCKDSIPFNISTSTNFINGGISTSGTACLGNATGFADVSTGTPAATTWQWDFGDFNTSTAANPSHAYASAGAFTVQLIVSNGVCDDTVSTSVTVSPAPTVNAGPDLVLCSNTIVFSTLTGTMTGATSFYWSATQIVSWTDSLSATTDAYYSGAAVSSGSMDFILTASAPGCLPVDDSIHVTFTPPHSAYAGVDITVCSTSPIVLNGAITGSPSATWSGAGTFSPSAATLTGVTYTPTAAEISAGSAVVTLTTDVNGACVVASDPITINILTAPVADAGADQSVCAAGTAVLSGSGSTGSITSYQWDEVGGPAIGSTVSVSVAPVTTTSYILTVDNGTCTDADTVTVSITTPPDPAFSYASSNFCTNGGLQSPTAVTAGGTYSLLAGTLTINNSTGEIDPSTGSGNYDVIYTLTSPCTNADTIAITINSPPAVTITPTPNDHTLCFGDTLVFTTVPATGTWTPVGGLNTGTGEFYATAAGPGSKIIEYSFTDGATGCTGTDTFNVVVNLPPTVTMTGMGTGPFCPSDGPMTLTGSPAGGGFVLNGSIVSVTSTYNYDPTTPGVDSVAYVYQSPVTGCINFDYDLVVVTAGPPVPILTTTAPYLFCESLPQTLTVSNPATTVNWYADAGMSTLITSGVTCSSVLLPSGTSTAYVTNATPSGCESAPLLVNYSHFTFTDVSFGGPYSTCSGTPVEIQLTVPTGIGYAWLPDTGLTDTAAIHPMVTPLQTNTYTVQLTQSAMTGCIKYDSVRVDVRPCSLDNVTNAFSPDGDGINDSWIIAGIEQHPQNRVVVFNRWGDKLLQFDGYNNTSVVWDGKYNGVMVASGTYYFVIEYLDDAQKAAGWLQLNY